MENTENKNKFMSVNITSEEFLAGKVEKLFKQQAHDGYMLVGSDMRRGFEFAPCDSADIDFTVELTDFMSSDYPHNQFDLLCEVYASAGWEYVTSYEMMHIFKAPHGTPPVDVGVEREHEAERYDNLAYRDMRQSNGQIFFTVLMAAICAMCSLVLFSESPLRAIAVPAVALFGTMTLGGLFSIFVARRNAKKNAKNAVSLRNGEQHILEKPIKIKKTGLLNNVFAALPFLIGANFGIVFTNKAEIKIVPVLIENAVLVGMIFLYYLLPAAIRKVAQIVFYLTGGTIFIVCPIILLIMKFGDGYKTRDVILWLFLMIVGIFTSIIGVGMLKKRIREHREKSEEEG
jgi:hypothetical protein